MARATPGRLLNLDTFQVLLLDRRSGFEASRNPICVSTVSSTVEDAVVSKDVSRQELADVIVYLATLKGVTAQ